MNSQSANSLLGAFVWIISRKKLLQAAHRHPDIESPLDVWFRIAQRADWKDLTEVRGTWAYADAAGTCTVFNIKGNKYRLIVWINYATGRLFIRHVLTHAEYTKGGWKRDCFGA